MYLCLLEKTTTNNVKIKVRNFIQSVSPFQLERVKALRKFFYDYLD